MKPRYLLALLIAPVIAHAQLNIPGLLQNATSAARQSMQEQQEQQVFNDMETQKAQRHQQLEQERAEEKARNVQRAREREQARAEEKREAMANNPRCKGKDENCRHYLEYHVTCSNYTKDDLDVLEGGWRRNQAKQGQLQREQQQKKELWARMSAICPEVSNENINAGERFVICRNRGVAESDLVASYDQAPMAIQAVLIKTIQIIYAYNVRNPKKGNEILIWAHNCARGVCGPSPL